MIAHRPWPTVAILVLAAGGSRRLGRPKQLVRWQGRSLLLHAVERALALKPAWLGVVLGARAGRLAAELEGAAVDAIVVARDWRRGLSASLRAGLERVPVGPSQLLVTSVDQWALKSGDLERLLRTPAKGAVAAAYSGAVGIPARFPRPSFRALRGLQGDRGARALLAAPGTVAVAMPRAAIDLDVPDDLKRLRAWRRNQTDK